MARNGTSTTLRTALGISLLVAGLGVLIQYSVGVPGFPDIPPGPIILGVAGILVLALPRYRWVIVAGLIAALFVTVGGLIEGSVWGRLGEPGRFDVWIGVFMQWAGQAVALVSAVMALTRDHRKAPLPR
ncbi:hypothetical protein AMIS_65240 [Actinoplanes missouriensis 431]|uniref:Integral membrane protein n=1 Tax=Actinoplanes missouriensis (strain ATCC 14538 / DSM 43046 / CBS 188.64 / JCM 3121 / NBRC 102363 / NCIMB 12654 / NRRL B-3342 / UNCC 431) TaxID=512565 RepID=I0HFF7_ACTM4|nr:hypothetical protein [Actinoplanes missouriensis]BAL91744.1 hypothetical protein AMIS_65240 [Actinoplanes missouriensis 431]